MSVLKHITIICLGLLLILESSAVSIVAFTEDDIAVNSLDLLSESIGRIEQENTSNIISTIDSSTVQPELRLGIESLLEANQEYAKNTISLADSGSISSSVSPSLGEMIGSVEGLNTF